MKKPVTIADIPNSVWDKQFKGNQSHSGWFLSAIELKRAADIIYEISKSNN